jgi:hypothetical protein
VNKTVEKRKNPKPAFSGCLQIGFLIHDNQIEKVTTIPKTNNAKNVAIAIFPREKFPFQKIERLNSFKNTSHLPYL